MSLKELWNSYKEHAIEKTKVVATLPKRELALLPISLRAESLKKKEIAQKLLKRKRDKGFIVATVSEMVQRGYISQDEAGMHRSLLWNPRDKVMWFMVAYRSGFKNKSGGYVRLPSWVSLEYKHWLERETPVSRFTRDGYH